MFKDIITYLSVSKGNEAIADFAVSVASTLEAHITGIAMVFVLNTPGASMGYLPLEKIEPQQREYEAAAKTARDHFAAATARAGVSAAPQLLHTSFAKAANLFGRIARGFDLAIVGQAKPDGNAVERMISESTLFESGRPVIIVPYIQKAPIKLDRIMVCWDGSRSAARAVADAMPFLERAKNVEVVVVTNERGKRDEIEGADIGQHLARHGLNVEVTRITHGNLDVADALLSHSVDASADFMVMGGYGHSRLREFVLGGVTRTILRTMTLPTLMSH
jgi:nucleotide-binding universal stress UspA family protein